MAEPCRHKGSAIPWPSPQGHPLGQGTPYRVPDQPFLMIPFDVLTCLEGQTNSESYETRTVVSVSKIASQGSRIVSIRLRCFEKSPENQRKRAQKSEPTTRGRPLSPPTGEPGHGGRPWPSPAEAGAWPSHGRAPISAGDRILGPRQSRTSISLDGSALWQE